MVLKTVVNQQRELSQTLTCVIVTFLGVTLHPHVLGRT